MFDYHRGRPHCDTGLIKGRKKGRERERERRQELEWELETVEDYWWRQTGGWLTTTGIETNCNLLLQTTRSDLQFALVLVCYALLNFIFSIFTIAIWHQRVHWIVANVTIIATNRPINSVSSDGTIITKWKHCRHKHSIAYHCIHILCIVNDSVTGWETNTHRVQKYKKNLRTEGRLGDKHTPGRRVRWLGILNSVHIVDCTGLRI